MSVEAWWRRYRPHIPDPPGPPAFYTDLEKSIWEAGWIHGYIAALGDVDGAIMRTDGDMTTGG